MTSACMEGRGLGMAQPQAEDVKVRHVSMLLCIVTCTMEIFVTTHIFSWKVTLLFFAKSRELAGVSQTTIALPPCLSGQEIIDTIQLTYPQWVDPGFLESGVLVCACTWPKISLPGHQAFQNSIFDCEADKWNTMQPVFWPPASGNHQTTQSCPNGSIHWETKTTFCGPKSWIEMVVWCGRLIQVFLQSTSQLNL